MSPNIVEPFLTLSIKCESKKIDKPSIDLYNQLLQFSKRLKYYYVDSFLSQHKDEIVILVYSVKDYHSFSKNIKQVLLDMENKNKDIDYKIGVSKLFTDLTQFDDSLRQAEQAVCLPRRQKIIHFDEVGLLGMFVQNMNVQNLKELAKKELGVLLKSRC